MIWKKFNSFLIFSVLLISLPAFSQDAFKNFKILSSSDNQLTISFEPTNWKIDSIQTNNTTMQRFAFLHSSSSGIAGQYDIPQRQVTIGIPQGATISTQLVDSKVEILKNINLAVQPEMVKNENMYVEQYSTQNVPITTNHDIVEASEPQFFRSQQTISLLFQPLEYNSETKTLRKYTSMTVQITFSSSVKSENNYKPAKDEELYQYMLLNYEQAKQWRIPSRKSVLRKPSVQTFAGENWYKIIIRGEGQGGKEGIYKITGQALSDAGVPIASVNPSTIQIFNNGGRELPQNPYTFRSDTLIENAISVFGSDDNKLDANDYILFYGRSLEGKELNNSTREIHHYIHHYSYENVYWLTFGKQTGKRISNKSSQSTAGLLPETHFKDMAFVEEEKHNFFKSGIEWLGYELAVDKNTFTQTFNLNGAIPAETTTFRFSMASASAGAQKFSCSVNGNFIGEISQDGATKSYLLKETDFTTAGVLVDGINTIEVKYNTSSEIQFAYINWLEVEYERAFKAVNDQLIFTSPSWSGTALYEVTNLNSNDITAYDITDIYNIMLITDAEIQNSKIRFADTVSGNRYKQYIAVTPAAYKSVDEITAVDITNLRQTKNVDYIIITYDDFYESAKELESLRENWDMSDRLETETVKISDVINQFSWGISDPSGIRDFLCYAEDNWGNPQYVLLLGDGHYDYKNILGHNTPNFIIPYEVDSRTLDGSRTTDDWYTYTKGTASGMQMSIGRITAQNVEQAHNMIKKIKEYETNPDYGDWRKTITIVADDELAEGGVGSETYHTTQAETLAENHVPGLLNVDKIYLVEYPAVRTASVSGVTKPLATDAIIDRLNKGTLVINYIGHGNDELWSHERVLDGDPDVDRIQNQNKLPLWIAATCEFAFWDQPDRQSLAERIMATANRAAVGMISSSRIAYSSPNAQFNNKLYDNLFINFSTTGTTLRIGNAVMLTKKYLNSRTNNEKYIVIGDPAMRLGAPHYKAFIDEISPDSLQALSKMTIKGHIEKNNQLWQDLSGDVLVRVYDSRKKTLYKLANNSQISYYLPGNTVFKGKTQINGGWFNLSFIVPKDISYGGDDGRISLYFWGDSQDGSGLRKSLSVGGTAVNLVDHEGPSMQINFGENFNPGDYISPNATLYVELADSSSGINTAGDIGHQITMTLDDNTSNQKDITDYFEYHEGSYTAGTVKYPFYNLEEGSHKIQIKAWDNSNNSSTIESDFTVVSDKDIELSNVLNYPNPMQKSTLFSFQVSQPAEITLKLYSIAGRLIKQFDSFIAETGYNSIPETWYGTDQDGDQLANGVYLYKVHAKSLMNGKSTSATGKLVIAR